MIERWVVEEMHPVHEVWTTWHHHGAGTAYRFWSFHNARKAYEEYQTTRFYEPCAYRFCKLEIQPETITNREVFKTVSGTDIPVKV